MPYSQRLKVKEGVKKDLIHLFAKTILPLLVVGVIVLGHWSFTPAETTTSFSATGVLEVRITDHREAIEDFESLNLSVSSVAIHPANMPRNQGWLDFEVFQPALDLTRYVDGRYAVILEKEVNSGSYDGVWLKITGAEGTLKDGKKLDPHVSMKPIALSFTINQGERTAIMLDLVVLDKSDEAQGYEVLLKNGYVAVFPLMPPQTEKDREEIEGVVKEYIQTIYSRNYQKAYALTSNLDRQFKTEEEYLRENPSFEGLTLELAERLASFITYGDITTEIQGDRATVQANLGLPDGNAEEVRSILFEDERPQGASRRELLEKLETLQKTGKIPLIEGVQPVELVKESGQWRVFLNWANGIRVSFKGVVKNDLLWSFEPVQKEVLIQPGETLHNAFRVKNLSDKPITGKALHGIEPISQKQYLNIIQCFCFLQETLNPREEKELPLTFHLSWDTPKEIKQFEVTYEFYPLEYFEEKWGTKLKLELK